MNFIVSSSTLWIKIVYFLTKIFLRDVWFGLRAQEWYKGCPSQCSQWSDVRMLTGASAIMIVLTWWEQGEKEREIVGFHLSEAIESVSLCAEAKPWTIQEWSISVKAQIQTHTHTPPVLQSWRGFRPTAYLNTKHFLIINVQTKILF